MDERIWEGLLSTALAIFDDLEARGFGAPDVAMGGGTVLMMRMHHRLSKDIDLFLHDAQWLARLTPRLNERVAGMVRDYSEQANSVRLVLAQGDIDFVVAGSVTGVALAKRSTLAAAKSCWRRRKKFWPRSYSIEPRCSNRAPYLISSRPP